MLLVPVSGMLLVSLPDMLLAPVPGMLLVSLPDMLLVPVTGMLLVSLPDMLLAPVSGMLLEPVSGLFLVPVTGMFLGVLMDSDLFLVYFSGSLSVHASDVCCTSPPVAFPALEAVQTKGRSSSGIAYLLVVFSMCRCSRCIVYLSDR